eukprot:133315_1
MALQNQQIAKISIVRIKVSGAGLLDVNGNYDVCNALSKFPTIQSIAATVSNHHRHKPKFMYVHLSKNNKNGQEWEYGIYLQPLPIMAAIFENNNKKLVWVISRININNDNKSEPLILYYALRRNNDNVPPPLGWLPVGGIDPAPKCELIQLQIPKKKDTTSPLRKAIEEANKDDSKLAEIMFDLKDSPKKKSNYYKGDKGSQKIKQLNANPRRHINQPGKKSKDMRRVTGE